MKPVHAELAAYQDGNSIGTIRHLVALTSKAGVTARWTDHESDIVYAGNTYARGGDGTTNPIPKVPQGEEVAGIEIGSYTLQLDCGMVATFNGTYIPAAAVARVFDGATVAIVQWFQDAPVTSADNRAMPLWTGYVGDVRVSGASVEFEVESGIALLNESLPRRVFQSACTHLLFDSACGLSKIAFTVTATVSPGATTTSIPTDRTEPTGTLREHGWFGDGVMTFSGSTTTVALRGVQRTVRSYNGTGGTFVPDRPLPVAPTAGDTFSVHPGCPLTLAACENNDAAAGPQFNNRVHHGGFPFIPKNEAAI